MVKPIVDGLESSLEGQARLVRVSILSRRGREMARRHGLRGIPTFLIFDGQGNLIGRQVGFPDQGQIKALVAGN